MTTTKPPSELQTSVILVVKGAGVQKPDDTLSVFLNGFWPALKKLRPDATLRQRHDIFPDGYRSSPHDADPHNHLTEIRTGNRRIWIKEAYWEQDLRLSGILTVLKREWHMASYAFGSSIYDFGRAVYEQFIPRTLDPQKSIWFYLIAYITIYWLVLFWPLWLTLDKYLLPASSDIYRNALLSGYSSLLALAVAMLAALPPALETHWRLRHRDDIERLPAMANWVLIFFIAAFILSPFQYLLVLFVLVLVQLALLRARAMLWKFRQFDGSDTATQDYYSYKFGETLKFGRRDLPVIRLAQASYRYIVVMGLPITFPLLIIARILKWTRLLKDIGDLIEGMVNLVLGSVLGDVATYAMDPAVAQQVRSAVETDLRFFHDYKKDGEIVSDIHVFAHSLGTPITFEVLFNHLNLDDQYRSKIKTYITIGSVLSYFNQSNPVLDPMFIRRFPVRQYPPFANGFRWINFWNMADPITEFYGLDEYRLVTDAPLLNVTTKPDPRRKAASDQDDLHRMFIDLKQLNNLRAKRQLITSHPSSPTNVKTYATFANHSEYWDNLDLVNEPFAKRVLGDDESPSEWKQVPSNPLSAAWYQTYLLMLWFMWVVGFLGAAFGVAWLWQFLLTHFLQRQIDGVWALAAEKFTGYFPDLAGIISWLLSPQVHATVTLIALAVIGLLIMINFVTVLLRGLWEAVQLRNV